MWSSNAVMYATVPYNKVLFSILYFVTSQSVVVSGIALVSGITHSSTRQQDLNLQQQCGEKVVSHFAFFINGSCFWSHFQNCYFLSMSFIALLCIIGSSYIYIYIFRHRVLAMREEVRRAHPTVFT